LKARVDIDAASFRNWLQKRYQMRAESARDVASRARRASSFVDLASRGTDQSLYEKMEGNREFRLLSIYVRCHLKRAVTLYRQFLGNA